LFTAASHARKLDRASANEPAKSSWRIWDEPKIGQAGPMPMLYFVINIESHGTMNKNKLLKGSFAKPWVERDIQRSRNLVTS
jgi:hypothetical protein